MSNVNTNHQQSKPEASNQCFGTFGSSILKVKEIIRGMEDEILQYEKAKVNAVDHLKFLEGNIAGLRRSKTTLEIFFQNDLKQEVSNA